MLLEGKIAVITGAGSGVGRASALRFAEEGAKVVVADLDLDWAKETVQLVEEAGGTAVAVGCDVSQEPDVDRRPSQTAVDAFGRLDIIFNNVGVPTPRLGPSFEDHTFDDFERLVAVNLGGVFLGCKHAVIRFKEQGDGGVILNTGSVAGLVGWGGSGLRRHQGRCAPAHQSGGDRSRAVRHPGQRDLPGRRCPTRTSWPPGACQAAGGRARADGAASRRHASARPSDHRRGLRGGRGVPGLGPGRATSPACSFPSTAGTWRDDRSDVTRTDRSTAAGPAAVRSPQQLQRAAPVAATTTTRIPRGTRLREQAPVHEGIVHELTGFPATGDVPRAAVPGPAALLGVQLRGVRRRVPRRRGVRLVARRRRPRHDEPGVPRTACCRWAAPQHRRYRSLVQPSFVPAKAQWWIRNWIEETVHLLDRRVRRRRQGRAQRRLLRRRSPCSRSPAASACRSSRRSTSGQSLQRPTELVEMLEPIVAARRESAAGRPHQRAGRGRATRRRRRDAPALRPRDLLVRDAPPGGRLRHDVEADGHHARRAARSGPTCSHAVQDDRAAAAGGHRGVAAVDADRPDVRAPRDTRRRLPRRAPPRGRRCCTSASAPPTATPPAGSDPTSTTSPRPSKPALAFGGGAARVPRHARGPGRDGVGISALLDRLPNLRLDPDAEPPRFIGMYERGATAIPVVFG